MKNSFYDTLAFVGRVLVAAIFIYGGISKITGYAQIAQFMNAHHISGHLLPLVIALELLGGLALVFGVLTRLVAAVLAAYSVAAIWIFLLPPANQTMLILVLAEIGMLGGLLSYVAAGAGRFSVDSIWFKKS
ncbi:MAG TPA: DoxX family protein [Gammaproteobacteria bacterium]|nr:DoxX family protein [Gammaproteobacteria bacterium]